MKKWIIFLFPILLFSCFGESKEIQEAKQDLLWDTQNKETFSENTSSEIPLDISSPDIPQDQVEVSSYNINYLTDKFIDIEPIVNIEKITDTLDIKWIVNNPDIDKIVVSFSNTTSKFPSDTYILQTFKKGDKTFLYRAYKKYQVLDFWKNIYTIEAYVWENIISKLELEVQIISNIAKSVSWSWQISEYIQKSIWDENNTVFLNLPVNETTYWNPIMTGESSFTYSNISWFEIEKSSATLDLTCENIWDFLKQNYSWYYWNTCRPIYQDSFSLNVLSLTWEKYKYEKHYIDKKYWFYAIFLLEEWTWLSQEDLAAKNQELKEKTFETTIITDTLFKDMLK
jgi:hypothetical protein